MDREVDVTSTFLDTHAHFMVSASDETAAVIARARQAGLTRILAPAIDLANAEAVLQVASQYDEVYAAVGIHPNSVSQNDDFDRLSALAMSGRVKAIGETGLDYYRKHTQPELQQSHLTRHMHLAAERGLPIVLHNRDADDDILAIAKRFSGAVTGVMHCFSGSYETAARFLDMGYYISFAGNITYPSAAPLRDVASRVPTDRILAETDSPYLAPVPYRGKQNEPANVVLTTGVLASCRNVAIGVIAAQIASNAACLFDW
jgi:TatD DNase family protein